MSVIFNIKCLLFIFTLTELIMHSQDEYIESFKQSQRRDNDVAIVNASLMVRFEPGTNVIQQLRMAYGGMAACTKMAVNTAERLKGR